MKTREEVLRVLAEVLPGLRTRYRIGSVQLFGSYSRNEQRPDSDVDLAIEYTGPMSYREHVAFEQELEAALGLRVDVVDRDGLKPRVRERYLREMIPV